MPSHHEVASHPNISVPFETKIEWSSKLRNPYSSIYLSNVVEIADFLTEPIKSAISTNDEASFNKPGFKIKVFIELLC